MSHNMLTKQFMDCTMESVTRVLGLALTGKVYETISKKWSGVYSLLAHTKVYDCQVYARREPLDNLEPIIEMCYFVRYPNKTFG